MQQDILTKINLIKNSLTKTSSLHFKPEFYVKNTSEENQKNWALKLLLDQADLLALLNENEILNPYTLKYKKKNFIHSNETFSVILWNKRKKELKLYFSDLFSMVEEMITNPSTEEETSIEALNLVQSIISLRMNLLYSFFPLVNYLAKSYKIQDSNILADLQSEGYIGLINAIEIFYFISPEIPLRSYVATHVKQAIRRFILENKKGIKVPYIKAAEKINKDEAELETPPISKYSSYYFSELNNNNFSYEDNIPANDTLFSIIWDNSLKDILEKLLVKLSPRERDVICMHFGLNNQEQLTLADIGKKLEISRERVRQIEQNILIKLKKEGEKIFIVEDLFSDDL